MKIRFLPLLLITSFVFAQESVEQPVEPIITDLDRLVESVKKQLRLDLLRIMQDFKDF
mgnify:CR=1 FL=1